MLKLTMTSRMDARYHPSATNIRNMSDAFMDEADYTKNLKTPSDQVERRGVVPATKEADLSHSSTPPWLKVDTRDRSNRLLDPNLARQLNAYTINTRYDL